MRVLTFVTATCRDSNTQKSILCVYVPTTPVPTSGYFLLVPEDQVTELNWSSEQALQAIISAGLTAPQEIGYFPAVPAGPISPVPPTVPGEARQDSQHTRSSLSAIEENP
jgi:uncharacterized membrane protein